MYLKINNKKYDNFSSYTIVLKYNSIASSFRFDGLRDILPKQLSYSNVRIYNENGLLLTGTIVSNNYSVDSKPKLVSFSGYSLAGILEDCNVPPELYPLQHNNMSLKQICDKILPKFNLEYKVRDNVKKDFETSFKKVNANISSSLKDFLSGIASQKGIIISHDVFGRILFTKEDLKKDIAYVFEEGKPDFTEATLNANGQGMHSHITVVKQASAKDKSVGQSTVINPLVSIYRPYVKVSNSGTVFDTEKSAKMQRAKELSALKFVINSKEFVSIGSLVKFKSKSLNINDYVELYVEEVKINGNKDTERYTLTCVLKEVFTLETPKNIFENDNIK